MLDRHGEDATVHAAMKADKFMERGDVDTAAVWKSIVQAIKVQIGANLTAPWQLWVNSEPQHRVPSTSGIRGEAEAILKEADVRAPTSGAEGTAAVDGPASERRLPAIA